MMHWFRQGVVVVVVVALVSAACAGSNDPVPGQAGLAATPPPVETSAATRSPTPEVLPAAASDSRAGLAYHSGHSTYIFDDDELRTYELTLTPEALAKIDADPAAEEYVEGKLTFEGQTLPVGIRYKGSIGAFVNCLSGRDVFNPSGSKTCVKLSMKIKINWNDTDDTFYGVKKLQFHAQNLDPTALHERLGYWLFREMGVPAPRSVHARVVVNGEFIGLFGLTEQIDGRFTRENFDDGGGNLYKEVWPISSDGQALPEIAHLAGLKTNEEIESNASLMVGFATEVVGAAPGEVAGVLDRWLDVDQMLAYGLVDRAIANDDGALHFYCFAAPHCEPHNFYWYENPSTQQLHLIPWDLDNAFENIRGPANPVTPIADGWGEISNDCEPFTPPGAFVAQRSAACDPIWGSLATMTTSFGEVQRKFLGGPFSVDVVNAQLDGWAAQIARAVLEAADAHPGAMSVSQWERAVEQLRLDLEIVRTSAG
jgi:hypothetical protein